MGCALLATASGLHSLSSINTSQRSRVEMSRKNRPRRFGLLVYRLRFVDIYDMQNRCSPTDRGEVRVALRIGRNLKPDRC